MGDLLSHAGVEENLHFLILEVRKQLDRVRRNTHVTLVCGQGAFEEGCIEETQALGGLFESKGIPHDRDIWGYDVAHNWAWWKRQAQYHLSRRLGAPR